MEYYGLIAAALCVIWDGAITPIHARVLTFAQMQQDAQGTYFPMARSKTCLGWPREALTALSARLTSLYRIGTETANRSP